MSLIDKMSAESSIWSFQHGCVDCGFARLNSLFFFSLSTFFFFCSASLSVSHFNFSQFLSSQSWIKKEMHSRFESVSCSTWIFSITFLAVARGKKRNIYYRCFQLSGCLQSKSSEKWSSVSCCSQRKSLWIRARGRRLGCKCLCEEYRVVMDCMRCGAKCKSWQEVIKSFFFRPLQAGPDRMQRVF